MFHTSTFLQCLHVIWRSEYGCMSWLSCNEVEVVVVVAWSLTACRDGVSTVWAFVCVTPLETVGATARRDGCWVREHWSRWTFNNEYWFSLARWLPKKRPLYETGFQHLFMRYQWILLARQLGEMAAERETTDQDRSSTLNTGHWTSLAWQPGKMAAKGETTVRDRVSTFLAGKKTRYCWRTSQEKALNSSICKRETTECF